MSKKNFFKSFYFFMSLTLILVSIPCMFYMDFNRGSFDFGPMGKLGEAFQKIENLLFDVKLRLRPNIVGNEKVIVVAIDENSLEKLGRWQSWGRDFYAQTIAKLDENGASVIGFDVVFDSPDENKGFKFLSQLTEQYPSFHEKTNPDFANALEMAARFSNSDWMLIEATKGFNSDRAKGVVFGYFVETKPGAFVLQKKEEQPDSMKILMRSMIPVRKPKGAELPIELTKKVDDTGINFDELARASSYHGYFSMNPDQDGVVREYRLLMSMYERVYPSLALKMIERYWQDNALLKLTEDNLLYLELNKENVSLPLSNRGTMRLNYYGPQNSFITVSMADLLDESEEISYAYHHSNTTEYKAKKSELFRDSLVLIGATAIGIFDVRNTPKQVNLPGVEVHATVLSQFLNQQFFKQNNLTLLYEIAAVMFLFMIVLGYIIHRFGAITSVFAVILFVVGTFYFDYYEFFLNNELVYLTPLYLSLITLYLTLNAYKFLTEEKEKNRIKSTFKQYVSPDVVQQMIEDPTAIKMGGVSKHLSVMFTDIEGFTTISEKLDPEKLSKVLNIYLTRMTEVIFRNKGTLDKFIGDAIMAFWGAPITIEEHVELACLTAIEMSKVNQQLNKEFDAEYGLKLNTRIGINSGNMAVGNMGSETQFAYTVLGDAVNLAARLEGINKQYGTTIIISEFCYETVKDRFIFRKLDKVAVKGKVLPVTIYELIGLAGELDETIMEKIQAFQAGLEQYFARSFTAAIELFSMPALSNDRASQEFIERCKHFLEQPPEDSWTGVWVMKTK